MKLILWLLRQMSFAPKSTTDFEFFFCMNKNSSKIFWWLAMREERNNIIDLTAKVYLHCRSSLHNVNWMHFLLRSIYRVFFNTVSSLSQFFLRSRIGMMSDEDDGLFVSFFLLSVADCLDYLWKKVILLLSRSEHMRLRDISIWQHGNFCRPSDSGFHFSHTELLVDLFSMATLLCLPTTAPIVLRFSVFPTALLWVTIGRVTDRKRFYHHRYINRHYHRIGRRISSYKRCK